MCITITPKFFRNFYIIFILSFLAYHHPAFSSDFYKLSFYFYTEKRNL
ncbi:hypothetical protein CLOLEP_02111 [[Clostridium] leptum DSM 753]|uniref:Uncharacterized protein n=1 Tax=[Clostridium] leptum DSM 753 TaxID=428125 RepID=A7VU65_9FIRM|nr:hypothetical protein CLOLEP_02111 [[Clostridium] leptum DSM 753]